RAPEEPEAAALALQVRPRSHEAALLVIEVCEFDLQAPFGSRRTLAEYLENQTGPIGHLALQRLFQIALLDRRQRAVDDDQLGLVLLTGDRDILDLPRPEERARPYLAHGQDEGFGDDDPDREREPTCLGEARLGIEIVMLPAYVRAHDKGPRTAGHLTEKVVVEAQSSSPSQSSLRSTGVAGWIVEIACL